MHYAFVSGVTVIAGGVLAYLLTSLPTDQLSTPCLPGSYGDRGQNVVAMTPKEWLQPPGLGYLLLDGRFGATSSDDSLVTCEDGYISVINEDGSRTQLRRRNIKRTVTAFKVAGTELVGELLEPIVSSDEDRPLVVFVQGSERSPAIGSTRAYLLAAQGISVFSYDKRGTGDSGGLYSQNFELLADDAAAAMREAERITQGRYTGMGYFGVSQGGWVAPLAATRSGADFVAIGFGLVSSPIEEDLDQMLIEADDLGLNNQAKMDIRLLSQATARIVTSHFTDGFDELEQVRRMVANQTWSRSIMGEYSGDMLRMSDSELRRVGRALFDNLELIWDYDSSAILEKIRIPSLWVIAEDDREAPAHRTIKTLLEIKLKGEPVDIVVFPETDHSMYEYRLKADGSRKPTRVTEGYFRLLSDWILNDIEGSYGRHIEIGLAE